MGQLNYINTEINSHNKNIEKMSYKCLFYFYNALGSTSAIWFFNVFIIIFPPPSARSYSPTFRLLLTTIKTTITTKRITTR